MKTYKSETKYQLECYGCHRAVRMI